MAKKPTRPLKVTAYLHDGRINSADGVIMFDSIVYHAWFAKYAPQVLEGQGKYNFDGYIGLPLRQLSENRWAASRGIYEEIGHTVEYINKRPNFFNADKINYLDMDKGIIDSNAGSNRAYRMPCIIRTLKGGKISFYCMGHADELLDMLNRMPALGKKASMGFGIIDRWEIEEVEADYSLWHPEYGLMRPVPVGSNEVENEKLLRYPTLMYAIRPPYWKTCNFRLCRVPISGVKL